MTESQEPRQAIRRADVESVSRKLADLARDLPEAERAVLGLVLARAEAAPEDVVRSAPGEEEERASAFERPFAGQLARAAGLYESASPQVTVVVGWQYRFGISEFTEEAIDPAVEREIGRETGGTAE